MMSSDGSDRLPLAEGQSGFLSAPAWSPDGSRLAYAADRDGNSDIWLMDLDGGNQVNLTQDEAKDHSPAWSPDGSKLVFFDSEEDDRGVSAWLAGADWEKPREMVRGVKAGPMGVWSPMR